MATKSRRENGAYGDIANALSSAEYDGNFFATSAQTSHGRSQGDAVYPDSSGDWQGAIATGVATLARAVVQYSIDSDNLMVLVVPGTVSSPSHGWTVGSSLYLSQSSAGAVTATKPSSGWIQLLGYVLDSDNWVFQPGPVSFI